MSMWETLRSDPEASNWFVISLLGFWVRYPDAIGTGTATVPEYLAGAVHLFTRYGYELAILEDDLADCIDEFRMAYEHYYSGSSLLRLKKFAVVYHVDNFHVRVHKLIENAYGLLGLLVGLDPGRGPVPGEASFRKQVRDRLDEWRLKPIIGALDSFGKNELIKKAVKGRNLFVHQFREEHEWPLLGPEARIREPLEQEVLKEEDPLAWEVRRMEQASDLDRYAAGMVDELSRTLEQIRVLRQELFQVLVDNRGED